ncbi:uncharacterized protein LOC143255515 isoform X2 [Tachypleus tridentatus]|uniref:uncharacterized protein LOC143255515 isoform X2 n=1 Tax=Tachypleus tridentatus TaxID=6853 RepID=UPI003FD2EF17
MSQDFITLPTMNGLSGTTRKATICRYFATSGTCFYGNDCQFLHAHPNVEANDQSLSSLVLSQPSSVARSMGDLSVNRLSKGLPNPVTSLDPLSQVFAPTTGLPLESKLQTYMNTTTHKLSPLLKKPKSFVPSSSNLHCDDVTSAMAVLDVETSKKTPSPSAAEFIPMSSGLRPSRGHLTHSMSTPSFFQYAMNTAGLTASTSFGRFDISQGHSPCLSPNQSPLISRKSRSLTTTFVGVPALSTTTSATQDQFPSSGTMYQLEEQHTFLLLKKLEHLQKKHLHQLLCQIIQCTREILQTLNT